MNVADANQLTALLNREYQSLTGGTLPLHWIGSTTLSAEYKRYVCVIQPKDGSYSGETVYELLVTRKNKNDDDLPYVQHRGDYALPSIAVAVAFHYVAQA